MRPLLHHICSLLQSIVELLSLSNILSTSLRYWERTGGKVATEGVRNRGIAFDGSSRAT
jgi:hypothetical protein